ncbi:TIGR02117 family protein [Aliarcobacter butzleri]|uniref:TIGR02117 family protein n=1 Tax=Aliarcobacter butzleri TaxID=28197 RepID=UPI0021B2DC5A|nr:TIGR02117 family protein [Aliarcobacter butzleri]MCT7560942.1 TIGR02117 family protein [Aliarcobacter butzleri]UWY59633.1 TIGR02117 family protein [Aliarcobacter butzleri]
MKVLKSFIKITIYILISIFSFIIIYLSSEYFLSRWSVTEVSSLDKKYQIFIKSNGVHTDIVLPMKSDIINWSELFPFENTLSKSTDFSYVGIGWGDKGFYLDTPTWSELKVSTALIAGTGLGNAALHITYYKDILEDDLTYSMKVDENQYKSIILSVKKSLQWLNEKPIYINTTAQYGQNDAFYEAIGSYSIFHTCNTWTNNVLKNANLLSSKWVAFDDGILYQYKNR